MFKMKKAAFDKATLKKVFLYISKYRFLLMTSFVLVMLAVSLTLYVPILVGSAIDMIIGPGQVNDIGVRHLLIRIGIIAALTSLIQWFTTVINNKMTYHVINDMRRAAFSKLQILPLKHLDEHSHGSIVSRVISDVDQFADGLLLGFSQLFTGVLTIVGTLWIMLASDYRIALVVIILTPVSLFAAKHIAGKTHSMFRLQSDIRAEQTALINEMIGNQKVVQAFTYENTSLNRFDEINMHLEDASLRAIFYSSITNPVTRFVNGLVYAGVCLTGSLIAISTGGLFTIGQLSWFLNYANQYTKPFNEISGVITELQNALACAGRVFELIEHEPQTVDSTDAYIIKDPQGLIELKDVAFSYERGKELIKQLNLNVLPGQRIAIVGPTGSGKTTIINLLMRFYDVDSGSVNIDGHNIRYVTRESLRQSFGMVLQETWLKSGTVRENIAFGKPNATDDEIIKAAKASHAHDFIKRLPDSYNTLIQDESGSLSQGQKQLLCIARVMLCLPPILLLDEATSSIDTRTELNIQAAFSQLMDGRTSFIVAHRLSTIREADIILVLENGAIAEQGNHDELLARKGVYYRLYNSQFASA